MDSGPAIRKLSELRKGRWTHAEIRYFITFCVNQRRPVLVGSAAIAIAAEIEKMVGEGVIFRSALMVMPDHVHWLFTLGNRLTLGQTVGRLKSKTSGVLSVSYAKWQPNYFEHRLRAEELEESYALYMFLNPYRANLVEPNKSWPYWWRPENGRWLFEGFLDASGCPPAHWVKFVGNPMMPD